MLQPKRTKYRKAFKGRIHGVAKSGFTLNNGSHGLKALEPNRVTAREIEAARRALTREMKRLGKVWCRVFPDVPVSKKPIEVRMGSGKGPLDHWACVIRPGKILFEMEGVTLDIATEAMRLAAPRRRAREGPLPESFPGFPWISLDFLRFQGFIRVF